MAINSSDFCRQRRLQIYLGEVFETVPYKADDINYDSIHVDGRMEPIKIAS